jgi:uncharacterized protein (DUF2225 family)
MRGELPGSPKPIPGAGKKNSVGDDASELLLLLDKEHKCPVCNYKFKSKVMRSGKAQSDGMDLDLRPRFKNVDPIKYRVTECPVCGYADMESSFGKLRPKEVAALKDKSTKWEPDAPKEEVMRDYPDAYRCYKSALRCCLIRSSKSSIRGYTALNAAWLLRGWRERLEDDGRVVTDADEMSENEERKLIKYALRNLQEAELGEDFPICGMEETVFDYLMAALCYDQDRIDDAGRYVLRALQSRTISAVLRPKAEDLRDLIKEKRNRTK